MIPVRFYRDDKNVYYNNPDGTTKQMTIQEFEQHFSGGSGDLPEYSAANQGEMLSVDSDGHLVWATPPGGGLTYVGMADGTKQLSGTLESGTNTIITIDEWAYTDAEGEDLDEAPDYNIAIIAVYGIPEIAELLAESMTFMIDYPNITLYNASNASMSLNGFSCNMSFLLYK